MRLRIGRWGVITWFIAFGYFRYRMFNRQYLTEIRLFSCCERNLILRLDADSTFVAGSDSVTLTVAVSTCSGGCLATELCQTLSLTR